MAEALAAVGLAAAILQFIDFGSRVIERLDQFRSRENQLPIVFNDIKVQLALLIKDLNITKTRIERYEMDLDIQYSVLAVVEACNRHVKTLDGLLVKILPQTGDASWRRAQKAFLSVQQDEKIRFIAEELRNNVIYLTHHSVNVMSQADDNAKLSFMQADEDLKMLQWLCSTDPSVFQNRAIQQMAPGTGQWFLQSESFHRWRLQEKSLAWLHGIPGCGKTTMCAAIIEGLGNVCKTDKSKAMAYYYIDYNDALSATVNNILRSLIKQICTGVGCVPQIVQTLCSQHRASGQQPGVPNLIAVLRALAETLNLQIFAVIDALDEYPAHKRAELFNTITALVGNDFSGFHILVTSRAENDIQYSIGALATETICFEKDHVDADIQLHIRSCLREDPRLSKLPSHIKSLVETKLGQGAQGMFRWAVCQLDTLRACNKASAVKKALEDLPKSLFDTYERILDRISSTDRGDACEIMRWIAFAKRPLDIKELAEAATTQIGLADIDEDDKLYDPYDVLRICGSLVSLSKEKIFICGRFEIRQIVRFAHSSVREYLLSDHLVNGPAAKFALSQEQAHETLALCCLSVLLRNNTKHQGASELADMPLLQYAAEFWFQHIKEPEIIDRQRSAMKNLMAQNITCQLFHSSFTTFQNWLTVYDPNIRRASNRLRGDSPSPLYYAALLGLLNPMVYLLNEGYDVNAYGGRYGTPLVAAANSGDEEMARVLVDKGADVDGFGGLVFGSPLQAACFSGSEPIVRLLLEKGAKVNVSVRSETIETALQVACEFGYENLVRLLISSGADIAAKGGGYGHALQAAAARDHYNVVVLLLEKGADVNAQGGQFGTALQGAASAGSERSTRLLLDAGADPNIQGGGFRDALRAAAWRQAQSVFDLLLNRGADVKISIQKLRRSGASYEDKEIAERIAAARDANDKILMSLVRSAAKRIAYIESQERSSEDVLRQKMIRDDRVRTRVRKVKEYVMKQESDQYHEAAIPKRWLIAKAEMGQA